MDGGNAEFADVVQKEQSSKMKDRTLCGYTQ